MKMDKSLIIKEIKKHYDIKSDADLARFIGISTQNIYTWIKRGTYDVATILAKCPELSAEWLLTGNGEMLKNDTPKTIELSPSLDVVLELKEAHKEVVKTKDAMISLQDKMISAKDELIATKNELIAAKEALIVSKNNEISTLKAQLTEKDKRMGLDHAHQEDATCAAVR